MHVWLLKFLVNGGFTFPMMNLAVFMHGNEWSCMHGCTLKFHHNNELDLVHEDTLDWSNVAIGCWDSFDRIFPRILVASLELYKYKCLVVHLEHRVDEKIELQSTQSSEGLLVRSSYTK